MTNNEQTKHPQVGEAVIINDGRRTETSGDWRYIVTALIVGGDSVVRGARLKTAKGNLERAIQQLCPLNYHMTSSGQPRRHSNQEQREAQQQHIYVSNKWQRTNRKTIEA